MPFTSSPLDQTDRQDMAQVFAWASEVRLTYAVLFFWVQRTNVSYVEM